jgi:hypothetical protein
MSDTHVRTRTRQARLLPRLDWSRVSPSAIVAAAVLIAVAAAAARSFELDEGYTYLILNGEPRILWPRGVFMRADIAHWFAGTAPLARISADLVTYDVHPPLWFYVEAGWRHLVGPGLLAARLLSVSIMAAELVLTARVARLCRAPVLLTLAITAFSYAVLYTGATVRMYPFANALLLAGTLALLHTLPPRALGAGKWRSSLWAGAAGLEFGLGTASHLFVVFPSVALGIVAALSLLRQRRFVEVMVAVVAALPPILWAASYYAEQQTHDWQFAPFSVGGMLLRIAERYGAALFGGTPVYVPHAFARPVSALFGLLLLTALAIAATAARRMLRDVTGWMVLVGTLVMPVTLFIVGAVDGKETVELRYLIYGLPFLAMFLARGWREQRLVTRRARTALAAAVVGAQLVGAAAMPFAHMTQQAARPAMAEIGELWQPGALLLLPQATDTSGMTLDYAYEAPPDWPMLLMTADESPTGVLRAVAGRPRIFLILIADADGSAALARTRAILQAAGWHSAGSPGADETRLGVAWEEYIPPS